MQKFLFFCLFVILSRSAFAQGYGNETKEPELKILFLIIASDQRSVWQEDQKVWRSYMHLDPDHVDAFFIKSNPAMDTPCEIKEDVIWVKGDENFIPGILNKTILAMEFLLPHLNQYDYIIRTNLSSFYVFPRLLDFLKPLPKQ